MAGAAPTQTIDMIHGSKHRCMRASEARALLSGTRYHGPVRDVQVIELLAIGREGS